MNTPFTARRICLVLLGSALVWGVSAAVTFSILRETSVLEVLTVLCIAIAACLVLSLVVLSGSVSAIASLGEIWGYLRRGRTGIRELLALISQRRESLAAGFTRTVRWSMAAMLLAGPFAALAYAITTLSVLIARTL